MESRSFNIPDSIIYRCIAVTKHLTETLYGRRGLFGVRGQEWYSLLCERDDVFMVAVAHSRGVTS